MTTRLALALTLCLATAAHAAAPIEVGTRLPGDQPLGIDLEDKPVTLASLEGKPAVVLFWATWCGACMEEMRLAEALHRKFDGRFAIIAITGDSRRELARFLRRNDGKVTLRITRDEKRRLSKQFDVRAIPTSLVIDRDGVVRWSKTGYDDKWLDALAEPLVAAVNAKPGAAVASD